MIRNFAALFQTSISLIFFQGDTCSARYCCGKVIAADRRVRLPSIVPANSFSQSSSKSRRRRVRAMTTPLAVPTGISSERIFCPRKYHPRHCLLDFHDDGWRVFSYLHDILSPICAMFLLDREPRINCRLPQISQMHIPDHQVQPFQISKWPLGWPSSFPNLRNLFPLLSNLLECVLHPLDLEYPTGTMHRKSWCNAKFGNH